MSLIETPSYPHSNTPINLLAFSSVRGRCRHLIRTRMRYQIPRFISSPPSTNLTFTTIVPFITITTNSPPSPNRHIHHHSPPPPFAHSPPPPRSSKLTTFALVQSMVRTYARTFHHRWFEPRTQASTPIKGRLIGAHKQTYENKQNTKNTINKTRNTHPHIQTHSCHHSPSNGSSALLQPSTITIQTQNNQK
jgi:hypothetical protein